jgi:signal transduction histidine kinase
LSLPSDPRKRANILAIGVIAIGLAVVVELWLMVGLSAQSARESAIERAQIETQNVAAAFADTISSKLDSIKASIAIVAGKMRAHPDARPDVLALSHDIPLLSEGAAQASIAGPDGCLVSTTLAGETQRIDLSQCEHVRVQLEGSYPGLFIGTPIVIQASQLTVVPVSQRVESADGELLGVITLLLPPSEMTSLLRSIDFGAGGVVTIAGTDNLIRARFTRGSPNGIARTLGQALAPDAVSPMVDKDTGSYIRRSDLDGIERLFSFRRLPDYPLVVIAGLDTETALSVARANASLDRTIAVVATILLLALGAYLAHELRRRAAREVELAEQRAQLSTVNNRLKADVALRREAENRMREAEQILRDAVDSIYAAFVIYDAEDRLIMCNEPYRRLYDGSAAILMPGMKFEELLRDGLSRGEFVDAIGREEEWLAARMAAHREPSDPIEAPLAGGRWVLISERRMRNGGTAGLRIDITKLKEAEAQVRESQDRLNRAQRVAQLGSFERDLRTGKIFLSDEAYRLLGLAPNDGLPTVEGFFDQIDPQDQLRYRTAVEAAERGEGIPPIEYTLRCFDGRTRRIHLEMDVVRDADGQPIRRVGTMKDVSELREIEAQRRELERQLHHSEKLRALGTLAGGIAHDLNNALLPVLALSEMLMQETPPTASAYTDLETILEAARRGRALVRQILAFSRKEEAAKTSIDLTAIVRQSLSMIRATTAPNLRIEENIDDVPPILGDAGQLHQVVVNLLTNAAQAIGSQRGQVTVDLAAVTPSRRQAREKGESVLRLRIADTGCGMDATTINRIFEPFFTTKPVGDGTGLGLSVVHGIVAAHGGTIEVESRLGQGSAFTVLLPASLPSSDTVRSAA